MAMKPERPWALDLDDGRTSVLEKVLLWLVITCSALSAIAEVTQLILIISERTQ